MINEFMKKLFLISEEEKKRILTLHEDATKNLYLLKEIETGTAIATIDLKGTFPQGYYYTSQQLSDKLYSEMTKITDILKKYQNQKLNIVVKAGESQLGNRDLEPKSPTKGQKLEKLDLAKKRFESIKKTLESILDKYKKENSLNVEFVISEPEFILGKTIPKVGVRGGDHPPDMKKEFENEQFIQINIVATGQQTTTTNIIPNKDPNDGITKKKVCEKEVIQPDKNSYLMADNDYTMIKEVDLGSGSGSLILKVNTYAIPDCIYVEYNGKTYGTATFAGSAAGSFAVRVSMGTNLRMRFGDGPLPNYFPQVRWRDATKKEVMAAFTESPKLYENFVNSLKDQKKTIYPEKGNEWYQQLIDSVTVKIPKNFSNDKKIDGYNRDIGEVRYKRTKGLPWAIVELDNKSYAGGPGWFNIKFQKVEGVDKAKIICIAPLGTTNWDITKECIN
jgi:hypothetical protein